MEMLSALLSQTQPKPQSAQDTIAKLCDRLLHSNLLEDRRAAVLGLKGFSREYRENVVVGGLKGLMLALQRDSEDEETCRATLETLIILFIRGENNDDLIQQARQSRGRNSKYRSPLLLENGPHDFIALLLADEFTQVSKVVFHSRLF